MLAAGTAPAADKAEVVIHEHDHRSTPWGDYRSERHTRVFGPESGFRYEEYRTRSRHPRSFAPAAAHRHGRVIERFGPGHRRAAPTAPRLGGHARSPGACAPASTTGARVIGPAERAIEPGERLIQPDGARDGR
ncbi:hypothetical protein SAHL_07370 [Salinisphaera orenii YIM 95161]|uniref:Uncharacterized protein n=1 Tax=Salinisphaera orenii YIM 95161 TaxID=1051139 RepID=A0A423PZ70_9GAMM|nr:hypothetical protein SAHL_07370 [Salinisphaera halophila YIM 95161]